MVKLSQECNYICDEFCDTVYEVKRIAQWKVRDNLSEERVGLWGGRDKCSSQWEQPVQRPCGVLKKKTVLLRYNVHTIQFTTLKNTIQWLLGY